MQSMTANSDNEFKYENYNDGYYHFGADIEKYPDAWLYIVWSRRGPGKTYSVLWNAYHNNIPLIYMKRTNKDIERICMKRDDVEFSPWVPINRDKGTDLIPMKLMDGIAAFYHQNDEGEATGAPVQYAVSLNTVKDVKGIDFSFADWLVLDEFIPQAGEIVKRAEGEMLLDFYMTVTRDRQKRGRKPLKLILFANAEQISTPITNELDIIDTLAWMNGTDTSEFYDEKRKIYFHHLRAEDYPLTAEEMTGIYEGMMGTAWWRKSFGGEFSKNDFSCVKKMSLKHSKPMIHLKYKDHDYYIYLKDNGTWYMCKSKATCLYNYDLSKESDQVAFHIDHQYELFESWVDGNMFFQTYSMYDLIIYYKDHFKI